AEDELDFAQLVVADDVLVDDGHFADHFAVDRFSGYIDHHRIFVFGQNDARSCLGRVLDPGVADRLAIGRAGDMPISIPPDITGVLDVDVGEGDADFFYG